MIKAFCDSEKPTNAISSGITIPFFCNVFMAPMAAGSLTAKMASGLFGISNMEYAAVIPLSISIPAGIINSSSIG